MELVSVVRSTMHRIGSSPYMLPTRLCTCIRFSPARNGVERHVQKSHPLQVFTAYLRDVLSAELVFVHGQWRTQEVYPAIGVRQGCSLLPLVFRSCMEDLASEARPCWQHEGQGLRLDETTLHRIVWAGNLAFLAAGMDQMEAIVKSFQDLARRFIGLSLRPDRCKWAKVRRTGGPAPAHRC